MPAPVIHSVTAAMWPTQCSSLWEQWCLGNVVTPYSWGGGGGGGQLCTPDGLLLDQWKSAGRSTTGLQGGDQMRADNDVSTEVIDRIYAQKMKASEELSSSNGR